MPAPSELELGRRAFRARRSQRSTLVALGSTLVFFAVAHLVVTRSPGWPRVQATFFSLDVARESFPEILRGLWLNVQVLVVGGLCVLVLGLGIAVLRTLRGPAFAPLRILATGYVDLFRGMPLIITLYLVGFGFPALQLQGLPTSPFVLGTTAIVLTYSAYVAEVFRAGIESVHPSQRAAARSLGLSHRQSMRIVVLPQAVRNVTPALLNDFVALQKDVGLISVLGAIDAVRQAQIIVGQSFNFTPYVVAGLLFVLLAVPSARIADAVAVRARRRQQSGSVL
ncbi:MAG: polar amino acid transporter, inner rane subunit [Klenkia sp.]|nr:polar amino acid transporter, inner rane subunit [Klenkia sp.]